MTKEPTKYAIVCGCGGDPDRPLIIAWIDDSRHIGGIVTVGW